MHIHIYAGEWHFEEKHKCRVAAVEQHIPKSLPDRMRNQAVPYDTAIDKKELPVSL